MRSRRKSHRHLRRMAGAAILALITFGVLLQAAEADSSARYITLTAQAYLFIGLPLLLWATLVSYGAAGDFAGPERERSLGMTLLTPIRAADVVLATWGSLVAEVVTACFIVLPFLAALTLVGTLDAITVLTYVVALIGSVMVVVALGLAVSLGAKSPQAGVGRAVLASIVYNAVLGFLAGRFPGAAGTLLGPAASLLSGARGGSPVAFLGWSMALAVVVQVAILLRVATVRVRRHFGSVAGAGGRIPRQRAAMARPRAGISDRPLAGLDEPFRRRRLRYWHLGWVLVLVATPVFAVWEAGSLSVLFEEGFLYVLVSMMAILTALYSTAGSLMWWQRLKAKELLPLVLATPLPPRTYLEAALKASYRLALAPFIVILIASGLVRVVSGRNFDGFLLATTLAALALTVFAACGAMMGVVAPGRMTRRIPPEFPALVCVAPFLTAGMVAIFAASRAFTAVLALFFVPVLAGMLLILLRRRGEPRVIVAKPALVVGVVIPLLLAAIGVLGGSSEDWWFSLTMVANPAVAYAGSVAELCSGQLHRASELKGLGALAVLVLAAEVVFFLRWLGSRFDAIFGRIA